MHSYHLDNQSLFGYKIILPISQEKKGKYCPSARENDSNYFLIMKDKNSLHSILM